MEEQVNNNNGNGHREVAELSKTKAELRKGSFENAFTQTQFPNAMKLLVDQGEKIREVLMRTNFISRAERIAWMHIIAQCEEFGDEKGLQEAFDNVAAMVSERGRGRNDLVDAIIGDRRESARMKGGFKDWVAKKSGIGGDDA